MDVVIAKIGREARIETAEDLANVKAMIPVGTGSQYKRTWIEGDELKAELVEAAPVTLPPDPGKPTVK